MCVPYLGRVCIPSLDQSPSSPGSAVAPSSATLTYHREGLIRRPVPPVLCCHPRPLNPNPPYGRVRVCSGSFVLSCASGFERPAGAALAFACAQRSHASLWEGLTEAAAAVGMGRGLRGMAATAPWPWWCTLGEVYVLEFVHARQGVVGIYVNRTDVGHCWRDVIVAWEGARVFSLTSPSLFLASNLSQVWKPSPVRAALLSARAAELRCSRRYDCSLQCGCRD